MINNNNNNNKHSTGCPVPRRPGEISRPTPTKSAKGQLADMLRGRLGDDEMFPGSMRFEPVRSSSAPPTQESQFFSNHAFELSDPRMDPEYAVYYSNNMRMDPRLPPTAFAPGHSWKQSRPALAPPSLLSRTPQPWGDDGMDRQPMMHPSSIREYNSSPLSYGSAMQQPNAWSMASPDPISRFPVSHSPPPPGLATIAVPHPSRPVSTPPGLLKQKLPAIGRSPLHMQPAVTGNDQLNMYFSSMYLCNADVSGQHGMPAGLMPEQDASLKSHTQQEKSHAAAHPSAKTPPSPQQRKQQQRNNFKQPNTEMYFSQVTANTKASQEQKMTEKQQCSRPSTSHSNRSWRSNNGNTSPPLPSSNGGKSRSAVLEEFLSKKRPKMEIEDILGHIGEFCADQHGSRFIQTKLEQAKPELRQIVFMEILPNLSTLISDVFGNYVIQKIVENGTELQVSALVNEMQGKVLFLAFQMYGCRVLQKVLEFARPEERLSIVQELKGNVLRCVKDQNGNHVIQKAFECIPLEQMQFIMHEMKGNILSLATHAYGCRIIQKILEFRLPTYCLPIYKELQADVDRLIKDQYGNYVIQYILEKGTAQEKKFVMDHVKGNMLKFSTHKFASNVMEKCVSFGSRQDRESLIEEVLNISEDSAASPLLIMMKDQFANYVVQKMLEVADKGQRMQLIAKISPHYGALRKFTYGKHIILKIEKLS